MLNYDLGDRENCEYCNVLLWPFELRTGSRKLVTPCCGNNKHRCPLPTVTPEFKALVSEPQWPQLSRQVRADSWQLLSTTAVSLHMRFGVLHTTAWHALTGELHMCNAVCSTVLCRMRLELPGIHVCRRCAVACLKCTGISAHG